MATMTLDDIVQAAEAAYGSLEIELGENDVVTLLNPLRLSKENRKALKEAMDTLGKGADEEDIDGILALVAQSPAQALRLARATAGDLAVKVQIIQAYVKQTQAGEA